MKISLIRRHWSPTGGAENYLRRLARHLKDAGHVTHLICDGWKDSSDGIFNKISELGVQSARHSSPADFARQAEEILKADGHDISLSLERGISCDIYRAGDGVHRQWMIWRQRYRPIRGFLANALNAKNRVVLELEKRTFDPARVSHVIANSLMVKEDILRHFAYPKERIHHVPNGVDLGHFGSGSREKGRAALSLNAEEYVVLLVGAGRERKGHEYAKAAVQRVSGARLIIVDQPPPCSMPDVYAAADVFLLPTVYDPFANVTLEAMAAGLPVITTRHNGGIEAMIPGETGFVLDAAHDISEIARKIVELKDGAIRRRMGQASRERVKSYSLERNVQGTLDVITRAMA